MEELKFWLVVTAIALVALLIFSLPRMILGYMLSRIATPAMKEAMAPILKWVLFLPKRLFLDHLLLCRHLTLPKKVIFPSLRNKQEEQKRS